MFPLVYKMSWNKKIYVLVKRFIVLYSYVFNIHDYDILPQSNNSHIKKFFNDWCNGLFGTTPNTHILI